MAKQPGIKEVIEYNRHTINATFADLRSLRRINTMNSLRHGLTKEAHNLFQYPDYLPEEDRDLYLDYTTIENLGPAWDYILEHVSEKIDMLQIRRLHTILAMNTDIPGGQYRFSDAYIEQLQQNAPTYHQMLYKLDDVEYSLGNRAIPVLNRAFNAHYDIIAAQPFNDFNKRTARLVMNWFLLQNAYSPILFTAKSDKTEYMSTLRARADGHCKVYSHYLYKCMARTQNEIIKILTRSKTL